MEKNAFEELKITNDRLLVFIDDTGHEAFKGSHGYYGLGGCVVLGAGYEWLKQRWRHVRRQINGNADVPLHASEMERTEANFAALSQFFLDPSFVRIAAASTIKAGRPAAMHPAVPVMGMLEQHIDTVANCIPCDGVVVIVESSQRADPVLRQHFGELRPQQIIRRWQVDYRLMPKSSGEPGLEIADFIVSAAGSQTKRIAEGKAGLAPDVRDVFGRLPPEGCLFSIVEGVDDDRGNTRLIGVRGIRLSPEWT